MFLGAGCSGLSLLIRLLKTGKFSNHKILLVDKEPKNKNDRTWCFWEKESGFFEDIVYRNWDHISFFGSDFSSSFDISPYQYKMIRGIDFYEYCFAEIKKHENVEIINAEVTKWEFEKEALILFLNDEAHRLINNNTHIFNSIYKPSELSGKTIRLLQHFKGWIIETKEPSFNSDEAILMDFRVHQDHGTTFAYVLPLSHTSALVEYTLFTKELLQPNQYNAELSDYITSTIGIKDYTVKEEEFGVIPMTNEKFVFADSAWNIGTAGGQTKASSGYTFQFIQKQSDLILDFLVNGKSLNKLPLTPRRFYFYDRTLLYLLYHNKVSGKKVFTDLFKKNKVQQVLKFLDNESSVAEELRIISSLPAWPFLKAAVKQI
ncbi:MAG TPA: lycopene cyclase family protein [Chitinophagaceae bacterium]|nr:lycopene cyclase family protein [Chitinophagaceae bacterium]